jgi:hypothetical protein
VKSETFLYIFPFLTKKGNRKVIIPSTFFLKKKKKLSEETFNGLLPRERG